MALEFTEIPDGSLMALGRLSAAFPRLRWSKETMALLRERMKGHSQEVLLRAVMDLEESGKESAASLERSPVAAIIVALKRAAEHGPASFGLHASLAEAEARFHELTPRERRMYTHAKEVLWGADFVRRCTRPQGLTVHLNIDAEMRAHGVSISTNGERVHYSPQLILNPEDECNFLELSKAGLV
jgi:hypothetical protein